jgi:hypothetical protein
MAITRYNATNVPTVGSGAGQIPTANAKPLFAQWVESYEARNWDITDWMPTEDPYSQVQIWTGQSYNPFIETTVEVATTNASTTIDCVGDPSALGFRVGDVVAIEDYYPNTTFINPQLIETGRITTLNAGNFIMDRHNGEVGSGSWFVHAVGARIRVISRDVAYGTLFDDAPSFLGDSIYNVPQRFVSGKVRTDRAARFTPSFEADDHYKLQIKNWTTRLKDYREAAFIRGRRILPTLTTAGQMGGMIWHAEQVSSNILDKAGSRLTIYDLDDAVRTKQKNHRKGSGATVILGYDTMAVLDTVINPYKMATMSDKTVTLKIDKVEGRWVTLTFMPVLNWPEGTILITSKEDWARAPYSGMDWQEVWQEEAHVGGPIETWTMYGDFSMRCKDVYRQILIKNVNANPDAYPGRRTFGLNGL